jgi:hypothetical protein
MDIVRQWTVASLSTHRLSHAQPSFPTSHIVLSYEVNLVYFYSKMPQTKHFPAYSTKKMTTPSEWSYWNNQNRQWGINFCSKMPQSKHFPCVFHQENTVVKVELVIPTVLIWIFHWKYCYSDHSISELHTFNYYSYQLWPNETHYCCESCIRFIGEISTP